MTPVGREQMSPKSAALGDRYATLLVVMCLVYALGDRWIALILRIPGTPIYSGEAVLALGAAFYAFNTRSLRLSIKGFTPIAVMSLLLIWLAIRIVPSISRFGTFGVRDSSPLYYLLFGLFIVGAAQHSPQVFAAALRRYLRLIPYLVTFYPVAYAAGVMVEMPTIPGHTAQILTIRPANTALHVGLCVTVALVAPDGLMPDRRRVYSLAVGGATIVMLATQNRSGFIATSIMVFLAMLYARPKGTRAVDRAGTVALMLVAFLALFWLSGISIETDRNDRELSAEQFFDVLENLASGGKSGEAAYTNTVDFRNELWRLAWREVRLADAELIGLGFGEPLGTRILPLHGIGDSELRSPHNTHLNVLVRTGYVGLTLWIAMWLTWFGSVLSIARRNRLTPLNKMAVSVSVGALPAMLFNAYFDPTLETVQQAMWSMTLFAFGLLGASNMLPDVKAEEPTLSDALRPGVVAT